MKYNNQWRKKKLIDVCKVVRFMSNGNFKETESEDSTFFSMNIPLWTTILCSSITDGFHFIAEILPPSGKKFDQEALKIKIDAFKGIPSKYEMVLCVNENGCPRLTMYHFVFRRNAFESINLDLQGFLVEFLPARREYLGDEVESIRYR